MSDISRRDFLKLFGLKAVGKILDKEETTAPSMAEDQETPGMNQGRLILKRIREKPLTCAFCHHQCGLIVSTEDDRIIGCEGDPDHIVNQGVMYCAAEDFLARRQLLDEKRITKVLYRGPGSTAWEEKDWDWTLDRIAHKIKETRDETFETTDENGVTVNRTQAIGHLGSVSVYNEELYLMHKMLRSLGLVNIYHHLRRPFSPDGVDLAENVGRSMMADNVVDYRHTDVFLLLEANPAEDHPQVMGFMQMAAKQRNAKVIVAGNRYTKTADWSDVYTPLRQGTERPFLYGIINYAIQNHLFSREYVTDYTNASFLVDPEHPFNQVILSGLTQRKGEHTYDNATWPYQTSGGVILKDPSLEDPNCVFQLLRKQVSRYDIETVASVTGAPVDTYRSICQCYCSTGKPDKVGNLIYEARDTQHTYVAQNVRAIATLQLLLGNVGIAGGGVNILQGELPEWGFSDMGTFFSDYPGCLGAANALLHPTFQDYLKKETRNVGCWSDNSRFITSMLKSWYGEKATSNNDYCFDYLPKHTGRSNPQEILFTALSEGKIKGLLAWGQNPATDYPVGGLFQQALGKLDWLVVADHYETNTASFWKYPGTDPTSVMTEVFLLPTALPFEKEGSGTNGSRWVQWRYKAVNPPEKAKSDLWIINAVMERIREKYQRGGVFPEPIVDLTWEYMAQGEREPDINKAAKEVNGYEISTGQTLDSFTKLKNDGSTACGVWLYTGYFFTDPELDVPGCMRRDWEDVEGLGFYPKWCFTWPLDQRHPYGHCPADTSGLSPTTD